MWGLTLNFCPGEALSVVDAEVLETSHPLHRGSADLQCGVAPLPCSPELHNHLLGVADVDGSLVGWAPGSLPGPDQII